MTEFHTVNPADQKILKTYRYASSSEIEAALAKLEAGARTIEALSDRQKKLRALAGALRGESAKLARQIALEMGKPLKDALAEVEKSASAADYYAENMAAFSEPTAVKTPAGARYGVITQPLGPLFAIMPWNFPVWQIMRVLSPAIALGNPVLLKHSDSVAGAAEMFAAVVKDACGEVALQNLRVDHAQAADIIKDPRVRAVTMTGSSRGGREVAAQAGRHLKKVVLELGGSDAYLVFESADIAAAARLCAQSRLTNNGQSCVSAKRFVVQESVWNEFIKIFRDELAKGRLGDPTAADTELGPLAQRRFREGLEHQTRSLAQEGGERLFKRELPPGLAGGGAEGAYFGAELWQVSGREKIVREEEFFGPVALAMKCKDESEALELANGSVYGLGGAVFSQDRVQLDRVARQMQCGFVALNDVVRSAPQVPFGGVKDSGFGRELGPQGFFEFACSKTLAGVI